VARTFNAGYYCRQFPSCVEQEIADLEFSRRDMYVANELSSGRLFVTILGPAAFPLNGRSEPERFSCPVWWIVGGALATRSPTTNASPLSLRFEGPIVQIPSALESRENLRPCSQMNPP